MYVSQVALSYKKASELLLRLSKVEISATQLKIITTEVGKKVFEQNEEKAENSYEKPEESAPQLLEKDKKNGILYVMVDGSAVNTRVQDEDGSTWREMKLGITFRDKDIIKRKNKSGIITQKEYVSYLGSVNEFKKFVYDSAGKAGYGKIKNIVVIGDGAPWIWNMCKDIFPDAECILDYYHLKENIFEYAKALYPGDKKTYTKWAETVTHYIETQQTQKAFKKISACVDLLPNEKEIINLEEYIKKNIDRIDYLKYRNKGYYIGSGVIESGNKIVVQKRLKQSGMRWSVLGAQYMTALRAKDESGLWHEVEEIIYNNRKTA